jgi:hypothetical protein
LFTVGQSEERVVSSGPPDHPRHQGGVDDQLSLVDPLKRVDEHLDV